LKNYYKSELDSRPVSVPLDPLRAEVGATKRVAPCGLVLILYVEKSEIFLRP